MDLGAFASEKVKQNSSDFELYYNLLIEYNAKFNLTAITQREEVYSKHFIDSAVGAFFTTKGSLIDVGSGGGFPAIPLKIINKEIDLTMLEATNKKCEFLKVVAEKLNLTNVSVINGRAEKLGQDNKYRERFDYCTSRAVARLNILAEYCLPFVKVGGKFIVYKALLTDEEILEAKGAIQTLGGEITSVNKFLLNEQNRAIIVIEKVKSTPSAYPRANGKIRKKPL